MPAAANPHDGALENSSRVVDDQAQPSIVMIERDTQTSGILSNASLARGGDSPAAHGLEDVVGLKPQVLGDERRLDAHRVSHDLD